MLQAYGQPIQFSDTATHLGIIQGNLKNFNDLRVNDRIRNASQALYSLFGAGLHGRNGLNPAICGKLWQTYIIPRLLYGAEIWVLNRKQLERMEVFQREKLRQIQNLPERTANIAVLSLLGIPPVSAEIDIRALCLFRNAIAEKNNIEYRLALRQLATKDRNSGSWFIHIAKKLDEYNLPSAFDILAETPKKNHWNRKVRLAVLSSWESKFITENEKKHLSTIRFMSSSTLNLRYPAITWSSCSKSWRETQKARIKAKVLCGVLTLQTSESKFKQNASPTCKLCNMEAENREHFMLRCQTLTQIRSKHIDILHQLLKDWNLLHLLQDDKILLQLLMDASHPSLPESMCKDPEKIELVEEMSRNLVYYMYVERLKILNCATPK